jgi:hypothetical protein
VSDGEHVTLRDQIKSKAERKLLAFFRAAICGENLFPWVVPLNRSKLKGDLMLWREEADLLRGIDKSNTGVPGPIIQNKLVNTRRFGAQTFPEKVVFESQQDLLEFLGKKREFGRLMKLVEKSRAELPDIEPWLRMPSSPLRILENELQWPGILEVCRYFLTRDDFDLYPRLFPLSVHSKFIEENRSLLSDILSVILPEERKNLNAKTFEERFLIRTDIQRIAFRIPDKALRAVLGVPFSELEVPTKELSTLIEGFQEPIQFFIVENKSSYLTFPDIPGTIVIFGSGFLVGSLERHRFLDRGRVIYWGDIDSHGLEILSLMREQFPHTEALLMSEAILNQYWAGAKGKPSSRVNDPTALSPVELKLYRLIKRGEKRVEQEKISSNVLFEAIQELGITLKA